MAKECEMLLAVGEECREFRDNSILNSRFTLAISEHKESIVSAVLYGAQERFNQYLLLTVWELCEILGATATY